MGRYRRHEIRRSLSDISWKHRKRAAVAWLLSVLSPRPWTYRGTRIYR